jgi:vacuolar-type H+-ATPase subunit C/Vma6
MTVEQLRKWYYNDPFQPFVLKLADGRNIFVAERNLIGISPTERFATVFEDVVPIKWDLIELASIQDAVPAESTAAKPQS